MASTPALPHQLYFPEILTSTLSIMFLEVVILQLLRHQFYCPEGCYNTIVTTPILTIYIFETVRML